MANRSNTSVTPKTWDGKYPLSDLPSDDTWSGTYNNSEGSSSQCLGFARMVLDATYGKGSDIAASTTFSSADDLHSKFTAANVKKGDRVTLGRRDGNPIQHAFIVAGITSKGITMYDCNRKNDNVIRYDTQTWADLYGVYSYIRGGAHHA